MPISGTSNSCDLALLENKIGHLMFLQACKPPRIIGWGSWSKSSLRSISHIKQVLRLPDASLETFKSQAFNPGLPFLLPKANFADAPATSKWFRPGSTIKGETNTALNTEYLNQFANVNVPLEITTSDSFAQVHQPLLILLQASDLLDDSGVQVYLAQASLSDLPKALVDDVPTPELVTKAGKGDIYETSIWLGRAPTYTPLHKDPNPNLFVQLAGDKMVRIFNPHVGNAIFAHVQRSIGGTSSAAIRGEEMMHGEERAVLEDAVWNDRADRPWMSHALECQVSAGDGLFIPKGWWHSIKGIGRGMTGSVNWWFR
ncbi:hypothetical protein ANO11243_057950 [Dothideomycetidae sp. 11243]|nr:hypothetical protein ANO11243_057950 [fungal sp. No.11243]